MEEFHALGEWASVSPAAKAVFLSEFRHGGTFDLQRRTGSVDRRYIDIATVAIGIFAAAAGLSEDEVLDIEDAYAGLKSDFTPHHGGQPPKMDKRWTHLPERNVFNTHLGYNLYHSGVAQNRRDTGLVFS